MSRRAHYGASEVRLGNDVTKEALVMPNPPAHATLLSQLRDGRCGYNAMRSAGLKLQRYCSIAAPRTAGKRPLRATKDEPRLTS